MTTRKYPPRDAQGLLAAGNQFGTKVGDPTFIGLTAADIARLTNATDAAQTAYDAHAASQIQAKTDKEAKDAELDALEDILQEFNGRVQNHPNMDDSLRALLGLPVYDNVKTPSLAPTEMPVVQIDTGVPLQHIIEFAAGTKQKGKPEGVKAVEIWMKTGGNATGDPKDYTFLSQDTASPYINQFDSAESGKQVHYLLSWVNSKNERGPWAMASATVTSQLQQETL